LEVKKSFQKKLIAAAMFCLSFLFFNSLESHANNAIRLIIRGDDMGMTQGSIAAFQRAFNQGVLTCASIQVTAPWFEAAAALSKGNPKWCLGVHLAIIGEWRGYRWRPVLPWDNVSSIVDKDGFLYRHPEELLSNKPDINEIEAEFRAQIELAIKKGVNVQYLDTHYLGYNSYPGLRNVFIKTARAFDLPISGMMGETRMSGVYRVDEDKKTEVAVKQLKRLKPGLWLWVTHLGIDSPEQNALIHTHPDHVVPGGGVGKHRAAELRAITSKEVKSIISEKGIELITYRDLWKDRTKP
jgi:predicted glycoside hydrolase/deacetylase ChbG (UPF0249 family)